MFGAHDVHSVFHVAKSENRNQVHYGIRLDASCRPLGERPVFAYWRRLRSGNVVLGPLDRWGNMFYGPSDEQTVSVGKGSSSVSLYIKALKRVRIRVAIEKAERGCRAAAFTTIADVPAKLSHAYIQLGLIKLSVRYVDVVGFRVPGGARVAERYYH